MCVLPSLPNSPHSPALHTRHQLCPFPGSGASIVPSLHHTHAELTLSSTTCRSEAVGEAVSEAPAVVVDRAKVTPLPPPPSSKSRPALLESMASTPPLYLCVGGGLRWSKEAWTLRSAIEAADTLRLICKSQTPHPTHASQSNHRYTRYTGFGRRLQSLLSQRSGVYPHPPLNIKWAAHQQRLNPTSSSTTSSRPTATTMPSPTSSSSSSRRNRGVRLLSCVAVAGCCCLVPGTLAFLPFSPPLLSSSSTPSVLGAATRRPMRASTIKVFTRNLSGGLDPPFFFGTCLNEGEEGAEDG